MHVVVVAVHLDARAVELPLHRCEPDVVERGGDVGRPRREHRLHAATDLEPDAVQAGLALGERDDRDADRGRPTSIAARRTSATGTDAALAIASVMRPASAP